MSKNIVIMGAAGRDFHVFNCMYRDNGQMSTLLRSLLTQIPHIDDRRYPEELAGSLYPGGIPIVPEEQLDELLDSGDV